MQGPGITVEFGRIYLLESAFLQVFCFFSVVGDDLVKHSDDLERAIMIMVPTP
jgi:hypothetical protein